MENTAGRFGSRPADVQGFRLDEHSSEEVTDDDVPGDSLENPIILDDDDGSHDDHAHNPTALTPNCRICFGTENTTRKGPLISLGCKCKNELSIGHRLCLLKWFKPRLASVLEVDCEVCKGFLGKTLLSPLLKNHLPAYVRQSVKPSMIVLVQVRVQDFRGLQVPIDTPAFDTLDRDASQRIQYLLRAEQMRYKHRLRVTPDDVIHDRDRREQRRRVRQLALSEYMIDMVMVKRTPEVIRSEQCAFFPRRGGPPNIRIVLHDGIGEHILRVPASGPQEAVLRTSEELARHWDLIDDKPWHEAYILLPRPMIVDAILTDAGDGPAPGPSASASAPASASGRRQVTYGRYVMIPFRPLSR